MDIDSELCRNLEQARSLVHKVRENVQCNPRYTSTSLKLREAEENIEIVEKLMTHEE